MRRALASYGERQNTNSAWSQCRGGHFSRIRANYKQASLNYLHCKMSASVEHNNMRGGRRYCTGNGEKEVRRVSKYRRAFHDNGVIYEQASSNHFHFETPASVERGIVMRGTLVLYAEWRNVISGWSRSTGAHLSIMR
jgi:hypothetical protein